MSAPFGVIDWSTWYSGTSPKSLNWTAANCVSGTEPWTPLTIAFASDFASSMPPDMLPVVSIASSTSALAGFAGIVTILPVSVALPPAGTVKDALDGDSDAAAVAATTSAATNAATSAARTMWSLLIEPLPSLRRPPGRRYVGPPGPTIGRVPGSDSVARPKRRASCGPAASAVELARRRGEANG